MLDAVCPLRLGEGRGNGPVFARWFNRRHPCEVSTSAKRAERSKSGLEGVSEANNPVLFALFGLRHVLFLWQIPRVKEERGALGPCLRRG